MTADATRTAASWARRAAGLVLAGAVLRAWLSDDGLIYVRVVEQVLAGEGPSTSAIARSEAASGPLWALVLTVVALLTPVPVDLLAVVLAGAATVAGVWLAARASTALARRGDADVDDGVDEGGGAVAVPWGVLAFAAWPITWDFATSGLELGLVVLWLAAGAGRLHRDLVGGRLRTGTAVLLGLGPLLRPDLALVSAVLLAGAVWIVDGGLAWRRTLALAGAALALPIAWQVFRAGWYASLVPAAGLAKEAGDLRLDQGLRYLVRSLADGAVATAALVGLLLRRRAAGAPRPPTGDRRGGLRRLLATAGFLHLVYVVAIGGDFMRGRFLLPGLLLVAVAVGTVRVAPAGGRWVGAGVALVVVVGLLGGDPVAGQAHGIVDERRFYVGLSGDRWPISARAYDGSIWPARVTAGVGAAAPGSLVVVDLDTGDTVAVPLAEAVRARTDLVVVVVSFGIVAVDAGPDDTVLDVVGLADPIAAHQRLLGRGRVGHEKALSVEWYVARFGDPDAVPAVDGIDLARVEAARRALGCGRLAELVEATSEPMTASRFVANVRLAPALTSFRFHPDPLVAERELCDD